MIERGIEGLRSICFEHFIADHMVPDQISRLQLAGMKQFHYLEGIYQGDLVVIDLKTCAG